MSTPSCSTVESTIRAYFAAIRAMDREAWVATFAADAVTFDPADAPPTRGHAELRAFFDRITGLVKTIGLHEDHVFVNGNEVAVKWTGRGVGPRGNDYSFEGVDVFEVDARGKIARVRAYWNPEKLLAQL